MFLLNSLIYAVWMIVTCVSGLVLCLFRWGDPSLNHAWARIWKWGANRAFGLNVEVLGAENLKAQPCVYVANHQSNVDIAIYTPVYPRRTILIGKKELLWVPFFGIYFKASGNVMIDRQRRTKAFRGISQAAEAIRDRNVSIWIFPEGTRNKTDQEMLPFKKGAFHMAIEAQVPIVPIVSSNFKPIYDGKKKIWRRGTVQVRVLPPIPTTGLAAGDVDALSLKVRTQMLEAFRGLRTQPKA